MERIHVSVRARPLSPEDAKSSPWRISGNSIFIPNQPAKFEFDRIFGDECRTLEIYKDRTKSIVSGAIQGFNGTVFAYGQTSSGKTHTMRGSATEPGVIPMAVQDLFNFIEQVMDREFLLRMSYMEIYNEEINDLLAPEHRKLQIHESIERGIFVAGLREEIVASPDQVLELMDFGESHRHIGETNMNLHSSRSHTIFRMIVESREKAEDTNTDNSCDAVRVSVLNLVDLAGSERVAKTGAEGVRLKEGSHINKSLMTLGTVIKKLSEGAESQGGHVPYRDSKLTRILQPALGGNANTAIICNITLAQIHADETKSSLQFASRALRVTNCVHVNEILTDAALLKRQKKEIEELRAKFQASHSEHLDEEILNLRNTLLKSELERERISLELEEEKKAQAEREKRLQEQAKKIENLSSMVLCSNRDEGRDTYKKEKRRYTWCPANFSREALKEELNSAVKEKASVVKAKSTERDIGPLLPFEELLDTDSIGDSGKQKDNARSHQLEDCTLPDQQALLHVTSRRKGASRKKSSSMEDNELLELQREHEELLLKFESLKTVSEIKIDYLTRKLLEADIHLVDGSEQEDNSLMHLNGSKTFRESEAILVIKQLQEKITLLEMERSSSQQNLDSVVEIATEQTISAREKHEELYQELLSAKLEAQRACEQLVSMQSAVVLVEDNMNCETEQMREVQDLMSEFENSRTLIDSFVPVVEELFLSFSAISKLVPDLKSSALDNSNQINSVIRNHEKLQSLLMQKINVVQDEKILLENQSFDLHNQIEELKRAIGDSGNALTEISEKYEAEKSEHLSQIQSLQKELSCLSSNSLVREKENIRKDLEKTKAKLKDTESKLRNAIQEKTKLEGERACAEREIKRLNGQRAILERDINKRDSVIGRRRDSIVDRSSNVFDTKRAKNSSVCVEHVQEEYRKLEVLAFEMETTIASLEEELTLSHAEKEEANSRAENLACELQALSDELNLSNTELSMLKEEVSCLRLCSEESESRCQRLETSVNLLVEEKEDLAMQLTDALLSIEEEKAISFAREKATVEAINEKTKSYSAEIANVSQKMTEVTSELESCRIQCKLLEERLVVSENNVLLEKSFSEEKLQEIDQLRLGLRVAEEQCRSSKEDLCKEVERLQMELSMLNKERVDLLSRIRESEAEPIQRDDFQLSNLNHEVEQLNEKLSALEAKMHNDEVNHRNGKAKLRMRLRGAQTKLDAFRVRYKEALDEIDFMNKKFEAASSKLKDKLASSGLEILSLKKQLASTRGA